MKTKIFLSLFLIVTSAQLFATEFNMTATGGFGLGRFKSKSFNSFIDEYNTINASYITRELKSFRFAMGYEYGLNMYFTTNETALYVGSYYSKMHSKTKAILGNINNERVIELKQNLWYFPVGIGKYYNDDDDIHGGIVWSLPIGFANNRLESYYVYPDGTISYGLDKGLNGIYEGYDAVIGFQMHMEISFSRLTFYTSIMQLFSMIPGDVKLKLQDDGKLDANMDDWEFGYANNKVQSSFRSLRLNFGVGLRIF